MVCYAFYSFSFVYILYSTAVIWRINFIINATDDDDEDDDDDAGGGGGATDRQRVHCGCG